MVSHGAIFYGFPEKTVKGVLIPFIICADNKSAAAKILKIFNHFNVVIVFNQLHIIKNIIIFDP